MPVYRIKDGDRKTSVECDQLELDGSRVIAWNSNTATFIGWLHDGTTVKIKRGG